MSNRKWRNPYAPIPSKKLSDQVTEVSLAVTPRKVIPAIDLRTSVSKMRHNIKGISSTIRQVEETMDTLYGAMEVFEKLTKKPAEKAVAAPEKPMPKRSKPAREAVAVAEESPAESAGEGSGSSGSGSSGGGGNPLANIDIGQLLGLLQSPLVQNLLAQTLQNGGKQRKKEG